LGFIDNGQRARLAYSFGDESAIYFSCEKNLEIGSEIRPSSLASLAGNTEVAKSTVIWEEKPVRTR
jgi:hypothetical protein